VGSPFGRAVGFADERGVHPQRRRSASTVPETAGDGAEVDPGDEQLGRVVASASWVRSQASSASRIDVRVFAWRYSSIRAQSLVSTFRAAACVGAVSLRYSRLPVSGSTPA
jgi:hypothetical protein